MLTSISLPRVISRIAFIASLIFAPVFMLGAASAHHGWYSYDQALDMHATVTKIHLVNPHDRLTVTGKDGQVWNMLLAPPVRNRRYGYGEGSLKVGQEIRLIGERHPDRNEGKIHQIWAGDERVYEYLYGQSGQTITSLERLGKPAIDLTVD